MVGEIRRRADRTLPYTTLLSSEGGIVGAQGCWQEENKVRGVGWDRLLRSRY